MLENNEFLYKHAIVIYTKVFNLHIIMARLVKIRVASFFSGIGGFDLGFEKAGMKVVFQAEIDNFCRKILRKHWPKVFLAGDINDIESHEIPDAEVWSGGFPCQDLSLANQGKRSGLNGEKSSLFFKFAELISQKKPKWVVFENVPGFLSSNEGQDFKLFIKTMAKCGYVSSWRVLDAKYFGTPQRRRRLYVVSSYKSSSSARVLLDPRTIENSDKEEQNKGKVSGNGTAKNGKPNFVSVQHACIGRKPEAGPQAKGWRNDGKTWTLDSRGSPDVVCSKDVAFGIRKSSGISRRMDRNRYIAVGNAVPVPVAKWIGNRIVQCETAMQNEQLSNTDLALN